MNKFRRYCALLLALIMALLCAACGSGDDGTDDGVVGTTGGVDVVRAEAADDVFSLNCNPDYSFNPLVATNHSNQLVCNLVYENIVELDNDFNVIPNLIENPTALNDTNTFWQFDIVKGHTFHDGTEVTGRDICYSIGLSVSSDRFTGRWAAYQGASYDDDHIYITLGIADTQIMKLLNIPVIQYGTMGDDYPMGSGPYTYNDDHTELHAYEGYTGFYNGEGYSGLPIDVIYLKQYTTAETILSAFEDGLVDAVTNDPSSYTDIGYASTNEIHTYATTNFHFIGFNEDSNTLCSYNTFRVAMNYAFDRDYFAETLAEGNAVAAAVPMYPTCAEYPTELANSLDYNLELCKAVLENMGIQDYDDDGLLEYMSGSAQEIELSLIVCSDSSVKAGVARRFQEDMASIGLTVNVRELTWDEYQTALEEGEFDMYYAEIRLRNDFDLTELFDPDDDLNYSRSKSTSYETLINNYLSAPDTTRAAMYLQLCQYLTTEDGGLVSIGFENQQLILRRRTVKGADPNYGNPLYDFENWEITLTD